MSGHRTSVCPSPAYASSMKTGTATLPLHGGKAPAWLFSRMRLLAREITLAIVSEYGPEEMLRRLSDPAWFQAFGAVLGFDWHSSGVTTTVCGALKDGLRGLEHESGLIVAGGKGGVSRKTPGEIESAAIFGDCCRSNRQGLVYASKMAAKVDSSGLQDGYQIYHHSFFFTRAGRLGGGAAGHERPEPQSPPLSLAQRYGDRLRGRAPQGHRFTGARHRRAQHGGERRASLRRTS